MKDILCFQIL